MTPLRIIPDVEQAELLTADERTRLHKSSRLTGEPATLDGVGLLRHGTEQGNAVLMLTGTLPDGTTVILQTTWKLARAALRALEATPIASEEVLDP